MPDETPNLKDSLKLFKRLVIMIRPYWGKLIKAMSLGIIIGVIGMILPYLTKLLIDKVYPSQDVTLMQVIVAGIVVTSIVSTVVRSLEGYFNLYIKSKLSNSTSLMFFNHLQHLKIRFFDSHRVGEIMSRFTDVNQSLNSVNSVFQTIFVNGVYLVLVPPFLFLLQWKLALVSLISIPLIVVVIGMTGKLLRKYWKMTTEAYAELNAFQVEMLTHIHALKSMVLEHHVYKETKRQMENALRLQLKAGGLGQALGLSNGILNALNTALFTWLGWTLILAHEMTLGDYIAFTAYLGYLYAPLSSFVNLFSEFQHSAINLRRMFEYLDTPVEIEPRGSSEPVPGVKKFLHGGIEVRNLTFGYSPEIVVLQDINLKIEAKSAVAIVGSTGSGKTSLLRLLLRMETQQKGEILYDGESASQIPLQELRKQISVIWQEFSIFKGSILDNLVIGMENVDDRKVRWAIERARMDQLIDSLPEGLNTSIAEWGASLSGGQRQRLAIARALMRDTPIIMFDEATSNIDLTTESDIMRNLFEECAEKTMVFVTHRLASAALADKICFIESGRIIDCGAHSELLERCENYRNMYTSQPGKSKYALRLIK